MKKPLPNPKAEIRNPKSELTGRSSLGFRPSDFFRISAIGFRISTLLTVCMLAHNSRAGDSATSPADQPNPNWFSFGPFFGLNINTRFKDVATENNGAIGPKGDRVYQDGYVLTDSSGNGGGKTWNWGYQNASQVNGNNLTMHGTGATTVNDTHDQSDDPQFGFDLAYGRDLGHVLGGTWGVQAAFDYTDITISDNQPFTGRRILITDTYSLDGLIPPQAPYSGSFSGPGPLLNDTPAQSTAGGQSILFAGQRKLDADIYALRVGPYYEHAFGKRFAGRLGGGLTVALVDTTFSYSAQGMAGSTSGDDVQAGGYAEGQLLFSLTHRLDLFAGAQYQYLGTFSRSLGGQSAELDLTGAVYLMIGGEWRF